MTYDGAAYERALTQKDTTTSELAQNPLFVPRTFCQLLFGPADSLISTRSYLQRKPLVGGRKTVIQQTVSTEELKKCNKPNETVFGGSKTERVKERKNPEVPTARRDLKINQHTPQTGPKLHWKQTMHLTST
ncbi:hypothetical protein NQZ68_030658 [Dissostichus eleginoides]|nr:hypothetical protein NQZ68_030658 [Dissostichus eleginoides]